jgi:hypothetical protein
MCCQRSDASKHTSCVRIGWIHHARDVDLSANITSLIVLEPRAADLRSTRTVLWLAVICGKLDVSCLAANATVNGDMIHGPKRLCALQEPHYAVNPTATMNLCTHVPRDTPTSLLDRHIVPRYARATLTIYSTIN